MDDRVTSVIGKTLKRKFKAKCAAEGVKMNSVMKKFIRSFTAATTKKTRPN